MAEKYIYKRKCCPNDTKHSCEVCFLRYLTQSQRVVSLCLIRRHHLFSKLCSAWVDNISDISVGSLSGASWCNRVMVAAIVCHFSRVCAQSISYFSLLRSNSIQQFWGFNWGRASLSWLPRWFRDNKHALTCWLKWLREIMWMETMKTFRNKSKNLKKS